MKKKQKLLIYQVLPRLFGNPNSKLVKNGDLKINGSGKFSSFTSLALSKIKEMGFSHIWYTGIIEHATQTDYRHEGIASDHPAVVKGLAGSPYAIKDYYDVDPDLANKVGSRMKEFENLVERSHRANLLVIIDFVPNHVARQYRSDAKTKLSKDLGEDDNKQTTFDPNNNFYYMPGQNFEPDFCLVRDGIKYEENPAKCTGNNRFDAHPSKNDWYETIKINYGIDYLNGETQHFDPIPNSWYKMKDILLFWASKKVDAFRCDMVEMVPVQFWEWAIPEVKKEYPDIEFIAEVYNPQQYRNYIWNGKFDYLYDKVGLYDCLKDIMCNKRVASDITSCWQSLEGIQDHMLYFLENHDEQRIASDFFAANPWKAIPAFIVSATMNTNPLMVYFGQELGEKGMDEEGFSGVDGRTSIFDYWSPSTIRNWCNRGKFDTERLSSEQIELREFYIKILLLCSKEKAIAKGEFYDLMYVNYENTLFDSNKIYAYARKCGKELLLIVVNFADHDLDCSVYLPTHLFDFFKLKPSLLSPQKELITDEKINATITADSLYCLHLEKWGAKILKFKSK
ncbi:alpha-amylase [Bacteroidales bacterium]|nr:alpha-amylase [Bacteroidales bacterium]